MSEARPNFLFGDRNDRDAIFLNLPVQWLTIGEELAGLAQQLELFADTPPLPISAERDVGKLPEVRAFLKAVTERFGTPAEIQIHHRPARRRARSAVFNHAALEDKTMDAKKFLTGSFITWDDVPKPRHEKIVSVTEGKYGKLNARFASGDTLSINATNTKTLIELFGRDTEAWPGHEIELYRGKTEYQGDERDSVLVRKVDDAAPSKKRASQIETHPERMRQIPLDGDPDETPF